MQARVCVVHAGISEYDQPAAAARQGRLAGEREIRHDCGGDTYLGERPQAQLVAREYRLVAGDARCDLRTVRLVNGIDEECGSPALFRPQGDRGEPPGSFAVVMQRTLAVDKHEIEVGRRELLPVGVQR